MVLHGEIGKLGKKRSRTKINVMLKEGTCNRQENKKERKKKLLAAKKCFVTANAAWYQGIFVHLLMELNTKRLQDTWKK